MIGGGGGGSGIRPVSNLYVPPSPDPNQPTLSSAHAVNGTSIASSLSAISGAFATDGVAALLRLTPSETSGLANSVETLRDLFWTLYSKLDAVLQGFRVAYEVAGRIAEVRTPASKTRIRR
jgi:exocyst complex component 4